MMNLRWRFGIIIAGRNLNFKCNNGCEFLFSILQDSLIKLLTTLANLCENIIICSALGVSVNSEIGTWRG